MRLLKTVLLAAAILLPAAMVQAAGLGAGQNPLLSTVQYAADVTYNSKQMTGSGKVYHGAPGLERREVSMMGQNSVMLLKSREVFILMPQMNMAMRMGMSQDPVVQAVQKADAVTFTKLGTESVNGERADKYKVQGEANGTFWITPDGILVRAEVPMQGDVMRYDVSNIQRGSQSRALFEVPAGMKVMDASQMRGMMNGMMGNRGMPQ